MIGRNVQWSVWMAILIGGIIWVGNSGHALAAPPSKETSSGTHTQNWDRSIPSATRFTALAEFSNHAVRDNNTGLVWEQAPDATTRTWFEAISNCLNKNVAGTVGWRLPSVVELKSVQDPSLAAPFVPASVFANVQSGLSFYWSATSATTQGGEPSLAWGVIFNNGNVTTGGKPFGGLCWCVRNAMSSDQY